VSVIASGPEGIERVSN